MYINPNLNMHHQYRMLRDKRSARSQHYSRKKTPSLCWVRCKLDWNCKPPVRQRSAVTFFPLVLHAAVWTKLVWFENSLSLSESTLQMSQIQWRLSVILETLAFFLTLWAFNRFESYRNKQQMSYRNNQQTMKRLRRMIFVPLFEIPLRFFCSGMNVLLFWFAFATVLS